MMALLKSIPVFSGSASLDEFRAAYNSAQCVLFKGVDNNNNESKTRKRKLELEPLASISHIFQSATPNDQESWCIENETVLDSSTSTVKTTATATATATPSDFLSTDSTQTGYCSFILQNDSSQALAMFRDEIAPVSILPVIMPNNDNDNTAVSDVNPPIETAEPFWIFVGRNMSPHTILKGRSEHTDNIQHDGTFHYQLGGTKTWHIRPTQELMNSNINIISFRDNYTLTLAEGDVMVINTRLWWHRTEIPPAQYDVKKNSVSKNLSISYARDIYLDGKIPPTNEVMSNVEGAWAVGFIPKGAELPIDSIDDVLPMRRTKSQHEANCKLIVLEEDVDAEGNPQRAVVMLRDIQESEFFLLWDEEEKIKQTSSD